MARRMWQDLVLGALCINLPAYYVLITQVIFFPIVCPNNHPCCVDMVSYFYSVPVNILMTVITNIMLLIIVIFMPSFAVVRHANRERPMSGVW